MFPIDRLRTQRAQVPIQRSDDESHLVISVMSPTCPAPGSQHNTLTADRHIPAESVTESKKKAAEKRLEVERMISEKKCTNLRGEDHKFMETQTQKERRKNPEPCCKSNKQLP